MRKLIFAINLTADGCCDHTKVNGSDEIHAYFTQLLRKVDLIVYGRKTYELMVPYWPEVARKQSGTGPENEFAEVFTGINKVVFSRTLASAEGNTLVVRTGLREEIERLKRLPGGNISLGGVSLPGQLIKHGLVDECYFVIHPVVAGVGRRLFDDVKLPEPFGMRLVDTETLSHGIVALHYLKQ